jgi:hypothetical protein
LARAVPAIAATADGRKGPFHTGLSADRPVFEFALKVTPPGGEPDSIERPAPNA